MEKRRIINPALRLNRRKDLISLNPRIALFLVSCLDLLISLSDTKELLLPLVKYSPSRDENQSAGREYGGGTRRVRESEAWSSPFPVIELR